MKKYLQIFSAALLSVIVCGSGLALPFDQPNMEKAKGNLRDAKSFLNNATADKGGHRAKAIDLVNAAIDAVDRGIDYDRTHFTPGRRRNSTDETFDPGTSPSMDQPNMVKARGEVQNAINNLERASADKGGWRNKALGYARSAVSEINAGIEYDRTHR